MKARATPQHLSCEFSQLHRLPTYDQALGRLWRANLLFAYNCSRSQPAPAIKGMRAIAWTNICLCRRNWRLITNSNQQINMQICSQVISIVLPADMQYFVVRKRDEHPAYQPAMVIDDMHYGWPLWRGEKTCAFSIGAVVSCRSAAS